MNLERRIASSAPLGATLAAALLLAVPGEALAAALTMSSGGTVTGGNVVAETSANTPGLRVSFVAASGTITVSSMAVSLGGGVGGVSVRAAQLWADNDGSGSVSAGDTLLATGGWSPGRNKLVFGGFSLAVGTTAKQVLVTLGVGVPYVNGSTYGPVTTSAFALTASSSDVVVDAGNTVGAATVTGASFTITAGTLAEGSATANTTAPVLAIVNPAEGATVSPTSATATPANSFKVQIQIYSPGGAALSGVKLSADNGSTWLASPVPAVNSKYAAVVGTNAYMYEATLTACTSGCTLTPGLYTLRAQATNAGGTVNSAAVVVAVNAPGMGGGTLLVRDNSNQLCIDCHAIASHSSQTTDAKYGSWATTCRDCHTPHRTTNLKVMRNVISPPAASGTFQSARATNFGALTGDSAVNVSSANFGTSSFTNADNSGPCQVCHTRTQSSGGAARWRNTGNADTHYTAAAGTQPCNACHDHAKGFAGAGESAGGNACNSCHNALYTNMTTGGVHFHLLQNATIGYPTAAPTSSTDPNRKCLECHVDHDIFRPDLNTTNGGRGKNLRTDITLTPTTSANFTNRDFDASLANGGICTSCHKNPMTRGYTDAVALGTTAAVTPAAYASSAHTYWGASSVGSTVATFSGTLTNQLIGDCGKCHDDQGSNPAKYVDQYQGGYKQGAHNSAIGSFAENMGISAPTDPDWPGLCLQCHQNTTDVKPSGWTSKPSQNLDWYGLAKMSSSSQNIYSSVGAGSGTTSDAFKHDVVGLGTTHKTGASEGLAASWNPAGSRHVACQDCHDPHQSQPVAPGTRRGTVSSYTAQTGTTPAVLSVATADTTTAWTAGQWIGWTFKVVDGTAKGVSGTIYGSSAAATGANPKTLNVWLASTATALDATSVFVIDPQGTAGGNAAGGTLTGVWGLAPTFPAAPTPPSWNDSNNTMPATVVDITTQYNAVSTWGRATSVSVQAGLCVKCHSAYAYGSSPPNTPSGVPNASGAWSNTVGGAMPQSDLVNQFNPNNLSHHAVFARGQNQPVRATFGNYSSTRKAVTNANWPSYSGATSSLSIANNLATVASALPFNALPGWYVYVGSNTLPTTAAVAGGTSTGFLEITRMASAGPGVTQFYVRAEGATDGTWVGDGGTGTISLAATTAWALTPGLAAAFVPPYGPWSTLQCTDCHASNTESDAFGPHGSGTKWLLRSNTNPGYLGPSTTTLTTAVPAYTGATATTLCMNCHRADVYGDVGTAPTFTNATYSRDPHSKIEDGHAWQASYLPKWGIHCMNCHGGARSGTIHGTNLGYGTGKSGTSYIAGGSYSGKRLLAGAYWGAVTRGNYAAASPGNKVSCFLKGSADAVSNCANTSGSGGSYSSGLAVTYPYDDTTP